jgi:hypothetical protein
MSDKLHALGKTRRACLEVLSVIVGGVLAAAPAQALDPKLQIKLNNDPDYADAASEILLRPNVEQKVFFAVHYPASEKKPRHATVELVVDGKTLFSKSWDLKPGKTQAVAFGEPPPMPMAKPMAPMALGKTIEGPPFNFQVRLVSKAAKMGDPDIVQAVAVRIMVPPEYLTASSTYDYEESKLEISVKAGETFKGPPCKAELVLPKERLPVMVDDDKRPEQLSVTLEKAGDVKRLFVEKLRFEPRNGVVKGIIYLTVDGYKRAFIIEHDFGKKSKKNTGNAFRAPSIRLKAVPEAVEGKPYTFHLEVDYRKQALTDMPSPDEAKLEIGLHRNADLKDSAEPSLPPRPSVRDQKLRYSLDGPDGSLVLKPEVTDWSIDIPTGGVLGQRFLRVRLLGKGGKVIEWQGPEGKEPLVARHEIEFYKGKPPRPIVFLTPPKEALLGQEVTFKLKVKPGFNVKEAFIFLGTKVPPDTKVTLEKSKDGVWLAKLTMPNDKSKEKETVSLLAKGSFGGGAEQPVEENISIALKAPPPVKAVGSIRVTVKYGKSKPKARVALFLVQQGKTPQRIGKELFTDREGQVTFTDLAPGEYSLSAAHSFLNKVTGDNPKVIVVAPNETEAEVLIKLSK